MSGATAAASVTKASPEARALEWMRKGDKYFNKSFVLIGNKYEKARERYKEAIPLFKLAKMWRQAGDAATRAAECSIKLSDPSEAVGYYVEAGNCYAKVSNKDASVCYELASGIYRELGRFEMAGKMHKSIGESMEEDKRYELALQNFEIARDLFLQVDRKSEVKECRKKIAQMLALLERYAEAAHAFEKMGHEALEAGPAMRYSARDHFLRAGLCILAHGDAVGCKLAVERYKDAEPQFSVFAECSFLEGLYTAMEEHDMKKFQALATDADSVVKLDPWKATMMKRIAQHIPAEGAGSGTEFA